MSAQGSFLPQTLVFGSSELGTRRLFYKLVGHGTEKSYTMALEVTDFCSALVANFSLQDVRNAQLKRALPTPERLEELLRWIGSIQNCVTALKDGDGFAVTISHLIDLEPGHQIGVDIRLPPNGSTVVTFDNDPANCNWVNTDIMMSLLNVYETCRNQLTGDGQQTQGAEQVAKIIDYMQGVNKITDRTAATINGSPPKRQRSPRSQLSQMSLPLETKTANEFEESGVPGDALVQRSRGDVPSPTIAMSDAGAAKQVHAVPTPKRPGKGKTKHNPAGMRVGRRLNSHAADHSKLDM